MKPKLTTLGKVFDRVDEMSAGCYDQNIDVPDVSFDNLDVLRIAGEPHPIRPVAQRSISQRLGIPRKEAQEIIEQYRANYGGVQDYLDSTIEFAQKHEYVETITGRRRYIRDINAKNQMIRSGAERNAINAPIQGTAADMIKIAMIGIQKMLEEKKTKTKLLLQVHDELVFDLALDEADDLIPLIEEKMKSAIPMEIPILVESGTGANWLEAH